MAYEIFKQEVNMEDYFNSWDSDNYKDFNEDLKNLMYQKYLMKCRVFTRDDFSCQNVNCPFCKNKQYHSHLTVHHIRAKRNGGKNTERNGITLCRSSHQYYEGAKGSITIRADSKLPSHIRGHTFKLTKPIEINWKKVRAEMKIKRKEYREFYGINLSMEDLAMLMKFLRIRFDEYD